MSKHRDRQFFIARSVFGLIGAVLVGLVGWIAVRAGGPASADDTPVIVQPSADLRAVESTVAPLLTASAVAAGSPVPSASPSAPVSSSASPSASASTSASVSPTPSRSSASPTPSTTSKSATPSPSRTSPAPTASNDLSATYATTASWGDGFIATVKVVNNGSQAHDFTVTVSYPSGVGLNLRGAWNGSASASGNTVTIRGNSLAAGQSVTVGFQAGKATRERIRATGCAVTGGTCRVS
ncbi:cellulose binding domain-containing protein [Actinoplanes teichomyceticus]|uniref:Cellulose binding domain-containing protein n=1 Tax=Actinoplanes teichomyceticus TaxID=1867 RepID=A0A561VGS4_ACTTI|nr:cellulose binding domain-containing protein [Actinoplanes teichomyceticus]TWG10822.1 cellulose binding domain-containing protein [Actinoplanes teichomyceticus]GIF12557.1 hypothetical protein Ate01nite_25890 [Actinoplanes teichomyceticus]